MNLPPGIPLFLENAPRRLFLLRFDASPTSDFKGLVLHLPAFGEEMNKSRAMVAAQARAMAGQGYTVLVPDYSGTGDSAGEFADASWEGWLEDMRYCLQYLQDLASGSLILWGLRLGALMAIELASEHPPRLARLILWNPVLQGEQYLLQFLRLRLVNSMMQGGGKETVAGLQQQLEFDGVLEVSGYELSVQMFQQLSVRKARDLSIPAGLEIFWGDVATSVKPLPGAAQNLVDDWTGRGLAVEVLSIEAPQFWATQEIARADELIAKTSAWLGSAFADD